MKASPFVNEQSTRGMHWDVHIGARCGGGEGNDKVEKAGGCDWMSLMNGSLNARVDGYDKDKSRTP